MLKDCLACIPSLALRHGVEKGIQVLLQHIGWEPEPLELQADKYLGEAKSGKRDVYADLNNLSEFYGGGMFVIAGHSHANAVARWLRFEGVPVSVGKRGATPTRSYDHYVANTSYTASRVFVSRPPIPKPKPLPAWVMEKNNENRAYMAEDACIEFYKTGRIDLESPERRYAKLLGYLNMSYGRALFFTDAGLKWIEGVLKSRSLPVDGGRWHEVALEKIRKAKREKGKAGRMNRDRIRRLTDNVNRAAERAMVDFYRTGKTYTGYDFRWALKNGYLMRFSVYHGFSPEGLKWIENYMRSVGMTPDGGKWRQAIEEKKRRYKELRGRLAREKRDVNANPDLNAVTPVE